MVVLILQEEVLVCAVRSKSDSRDAEAGEQTLEAVEAAEGSGIAPSLTGIMLALVHIFSKQVAAAAYWRTQGSRLA